MKPIVDNAKILECAIATIVLDDDGILHIVAKPVKRTLDNNKELLTLIKMVMQGKKACVIANFTKAQPMDKKVRDYISTEMPNVCKAFAFTSNSPLGRMIANIYFTLKPSDFPIKMFADESEAKEWLKQYL